MNIKDWTSDDSDKANAEGWGLAIAYREVPTIEIQRMDEMAIFDSDESAWLHVYNGFLTGNKLHVKALYILAEENPTEFNNIKSLGETKN